MDGLHDARNRDVLLRLPIAELATWHLLVQCNACRRDGVVKIQALLDRHGPDCTLLNLVPRLRCRMPGCRQPPACVRLRNRLPVHRGPTLVDVIVRKTGRH
jgi:hypothetical protein